MPRKIKEKVQPMTEEIKNEDVIVEENPMIKADSTQKIEPNIFHQDGELVVDVFEDQSHFVVLAAIAGVQIKDLDISIEKDMMVIKGDRQDPHLNPQKKFVYQECYWGPFSRKIVLPENIDTENADAQMDKGMLTIKIPKTEIDKEKKNIELS